MIFHHLVGVDPVSGLIPVLDQPDVQPRKADIGAQDGEKKKEQINKIEKQKRAEALKNQQKEALRLKYLRFEFDKTMELLYQNDMGGLAVTCAKYRPTNMEVASVENAEFIISSVSDKNLKNKDYLKKLIKNWDAYNYFKANNPDSEILKKAEKYARQNNDKIDVIKAGIYISNILTVSNAPESLEGQENKDFIQEIIEHSASETDAAESLCKYNEYKDSSLALAIANLDDFRLYNQLYGQKEGDLVLRVVAHLLKTAVADQGYVARIAGKEFGVILPGYDILSAKTLMEKVLEQLQSKDGLMSFVGHVTFSAGVCASPYLAGSCRELLSNTEMDGFCNI